MSTVSSAALTVTLELRFSKFEKTDKRIASEVAHQKGASDGIFRVGRSLFPGCDSLLKQVLASLEQVRTTSERLSVPWPPHRAVRIEQFPRHRDAVKQAIGVFDTHLLAFHNEYPTLVQTGIANSNGLNSPSEYMPQDELFNRFSATVVYGQLTDANDWFKSTTLTPEQQKELAEQTKAAEERLLASALDHVKDQLASILVSARDNLLKTVTPTKDKRFSTQWLLNLQQFCELWPGFNLTKDPAVSQMIADLTPITRHTPETMKTSDSARTEALQCLNVFITTHDAWLNS
jgi:hypothetical protein